MTFSDEGVGTVVRTLRGFNTANFCCCFFNVIYKSFLESKVPVCSFFVEESVRKFRDIKILVLCLYHVR